ncbi:MAG: ROK family protein [Sulfurospirillum sp.]
MNLAIDIGGTNIRAVIFKDDKNQKSFDVKSAQIGLAKFIEDVLSKYKNIKTIGISYAGQISDGIIIGSPNIKVDIANIKEYFQTKYNIPLYIENDLTCALLAEAKRLKSKNICALHIGTGLGLGVMNSGKIIKGACNLAAELGHIPYKKAPFKCGCGRDNCIENFASGRAIIKWLEYYNLKCEPILETLKNETNPKTKEILKEFEEALLYAVGNTITLFNPEILVLGGGIIEANSYLVDKIVININNYTLKPSLKNCKIVKSQLKNAPLIGALALKDTQ